MNPFPRLVSGVGFRVFEGTSNAAVVSMFAAGAWVFPLGAGREAIPMVPGRKA
jgi:hypothetical protein